MTRRQYAGGAAATTITTPVASAGGGTVAIAASTGWPDGAVGKFHIVIDPGNSSEEKILVDLRSGTTLTFSSGGRGADGTASASHAAGASIWLCVTAVDLDEANAHVNSALAAHAATAVSFAPVGSIAASNVQAALTELDNELDARIDLVEAANWVTATRLAADAVTTVKILDANVTLAKLATDSVDASKILAGAVAEAELGSAATTWTPQIDQGVTTNIAKTVNEARVSKVGGLCFFWFDLAVTGVGTAGSDITISLPFAPVGHTTSVHLGQGEYIDISAAVPRTEGALERSGSNVKIAANAGIAGNLPSVALASGDVLRGSGSYRWA